MRIRADGWSLNRSAGAEMVKEAVPQTPVFANTGVRLENLEAILAIADGAITGTTFKREGFIWNEVDKHRVSEFMEKVKSLRPVFQRID